MPRPANTIPSVKLSLMLPENLREALDNVLWSELEGKVPRGRYQEFFVARVNEFLRWHGLDLAPFVGSAPGTFIVRGEQEVIRTLEDKLQDAVRLEMVVQKLETEGEEA